MHCDVWPVCTEAGLQATETEVMVGGVNEPPLLWPPPPQDTKTAKESATRIQVPTRSVTAILERMAFVSSDSVDKLGGGLGTDQS